jgi:4-hydroxyproline epimerase
VRRSLHAAGVTGANKAEIDHVELFGPAIRGDADSKNFVLCPGDAYDRSPCGTGTSAKLACLAADGRLRPGETWGQESVIGSLFKATFEPAAGEEGVVPTISGPAWVTAEATLLLDPADPVRHGIAAGTP